MKARGEVDGQEGAAEQPGREPGDPQVTARRDDHERESGGRDRAARVGEPRRHRRLTIRSAPSA